MNKEVLITGANGFIGQHLVNYLSKKGYHVLAMVREGAVPGFDLNKNVRVVFGDLTDSYSLEKVVTKGCTVVNLAANPYDPILSYEVNVKGTKKFVDVCEEIGVIKFIQISSQATKIKNKGVYAKTKIQSDELVKNSKLNWVILKPSLVYGEGEKGLFSKIKSLAQMLPFLPVFGNGKTKVYPLHVTDLCQIIESVVADPKCKKSIFDAGCLSPVSYDEFYDGILKSLNRKNLIVHVPVFMGLMAGKFFELLKMKSPPFFIDNVLGSTQETNCDARPIIKKYRFTPMNFDKGLDEIFNKKKIRVGVIGLGKMGMMHLAALNSMSNVKIVALIDSNVKSWGVIKSMGTEGNFYENLSEALKVEKFDKIFVLTPTFTHKKILLQCLKKGLSVFVEKPLCLNASEIDELKLVEKKYSGKVFVGYTLLFKRAVFEFKKIIETKKYGGVKGFSASYKHSEVFGPRVGWMFDKNKSGGGVLMNPGPHLFSVVSYLLGQPKNIEGKISSLYSSVIDDEANLKVDYGKFVGNMYLSWSVKGFDIPQMNFEIEFEKAKIITNGKTLWITVRGKTETILEKDLSPVVSDLFELNPEANGEAYVTEDYMFINSIASINSDLNWVLQTESMIHNSYKSFDIK